MCVGSEIFTRSYLSVYNLSLLPPAKVQNWNLTRMEIQARLQHRQHSQGQIFQKTQNCPQNFPSFHLLQARKKIHLAALILKVRAWDQFARLNVNGMKIVFLFKLFLKIKVWQQLARSRFPLHCLFVLEFIFSCNLRLESEWDPSPLTTIWQVCDGECPGDQQFILLRESPSLLN